MASRVLRLVRYAFPRVDGPARPGDRLEGALLALAVLVALIALPVAAAVGSERFAAGVVESAEQLAQRYRAEAVLLADAPPAVADSGRGPAARVPATWRALDGSERQGEVTAGVGAVAGARITVWLDDAGAAVPPPMTRDGALVEAVAAGVGLWATAVGAVAALLIAVRVTRRRTSARAWQREWARVAPEWTSGR